MAGLMLAERGRSGAAPAAYAPTRIVWDASVLIAAFDRFDRHHERAAELLLDAAALEFLIHSTTLAEVLVGPARAGRAAEMLGHLDAMGVREYAPREGAALRAAELRVATGLKMPDVCVLEAALSNRAGLATFDDALARAAAEHGVPVLC